MLPQYHASLTQRIEYKESHICNVCPCIDRIVFAKFEGLVLFCTFSPRRIGVLNDYLRDFRAQVLRHVS